MGGGIVVGGSGGTTRVVHVTRDTYRDHWQVQPELLRLQWLVKCLAHTDKYGRRAMPPAFLTHLKRRRSGRKPGRGVSGDNSTKGMSTEGKASLSRPQPGRRSGRTKNHCWWCDPENDSGTHQTRDHLFKALLQFVERIISMVMRNAMLSEHATRGRRSRLGTLH